MRHPIHKIAALALAIPLAGTTLLATPASAAPTKAPAAAVQKADDPYSSFDVKISAPSKARAGATITYSIKATNTGPYEATSYYLGGVLPKGSKVVRVGAPKGTECDWYEDGFWCWTPYALEVGEYDSIKIMVKLGKKSKGTAEAVLGVDTYDEPTGADNLSRDEYERMGIKSWYFVKKVKTRITR
ncbi:MULTISPECIES: hypothetical protein [Streptosporangium]|uniref:Repeat protein (TIGR01451 family) n=1 Tax=Streptosporangium brasiliense TaxID=47480 RepID=A0ABT9R2W0_9ACTN|nr:hypothetical protein [Streptosporangium brasiliense]MDP9863574.1 putative repeat protein (TIGR01451 family) [Streptosporangium brasiliense]